MSAPARVWPILAALWLLSFASTSQVLIIAPLLPSISRELAVDEQWGGLLIAAYGLVAGVVALITGPISDRVGRRPILLVGTAIMAVGLWGHYVVHSFEGLMVARAIAGGGGGVLAGATVAYVGDYFPYERRGWANGWVMSGMALGQVLGIPIGTVIAKRAGFQTPFLIFAILLTLVFVLVLVAVPQPDVPRSSSVGLRRALAGYRSLLGRVPTAAMASSYLFTFSGLALFIAYLPVWLGVRMGVDEDGVALLYALGGLAGVVANPVAGRLSDQYGRKIFIVGASVAFAAVALVSPFAGTDFRVATFLFCLGMAAGAARTPAQQALVSSIVSAKERGSLLSLGSAMGQSGFAVGGALAGLLYESVGFVGCTSASAVAFLLTAVVVGVFVPEPRGSIVTTP